MVINYSRRGRGESGDTVPQRRQRVIEDLCDKSERVTRIELA
jgi:hypothetical protein